MNLADIRVVRKLGHGGVGEVFLGKIVKSGGFEKYIAIKKLLPQYHENQQFKERFFSEAKLQARLNHPNIVQVFDWVESKGQYAILQEYVEGLSLAKLRKEIFALDAAKRADCLRIIFYDTLKALIYSHGLVLDDLRTGVIHRDISPANLMVDIHGDVKLLDFGIAKKLSPDTEHTRDVIKGKWAYMSPEQASGEATDFSSDFYSLAMTIYECYIGEPLIDTSLSPRELIIEVCEGKALRRLKEDLEIDATLKKLLLYCLRDGDQRPASGAEIMEAHFSGDQDFLHSRSELSGLLAKNIEQNGKEELFQSTLVDQTGFSSEMKLGEMTSSSYLGNEVTVSDERLPSGYAKIFAEDTLEFIEKKNKNNFNTPILIASVCLIFFMLLTVIKNFSEEKIFSEDDLNSLDQVPKSKDVKSKPEQIGQKLSVSLDSKTEKVSDNLSNNPEPENKIKEEKASLAESPSKKALQIAAKVVKEKEDKIRKKIKPLKSSKKVINTEKASSATLNQFFVQNGCDKFLINGKPITGRLFNLKFGQDQEILCQNENRKARLHFSKEKNYLRMMTKPMWAKLYYGKEELGRSPISRQFGLGAEKDIRIIFADGFVVNISKTN